MRPAVSGTVARGHLPPAFATPEEAGDMLGNPLPLTQQTAERGRKVSATTARFATALSATAWPCSRARTGPSRATCFPMKYASIPTASFMADRARQERHAQLRRILMIPIAGRPCTTFAFCSGPRMPRTRICDQCRNLSIAAYPQHSDRADLGRRGWRGGGLRSAGPERFWANCARVDAVSVDPRARQPFPRGARTPRGRPLERAHAPRARAHRLVACPGNALLWLPSSPCRCCSRGRARGHPEPDPGGQGALAEPSLLRHPPGGVRGDFALYYSFYVRGSLRQDESKDPNFTARARRLAPPFMVVFFSA